ncbi:MAG: hypothetical protein ACQCN3_12475 [Candidatus Bathyarchaeia archaeon]
MAPEKCKGVPLRIFSGKQRKLNRVILPLLKKEALAKEDVFHVLRITKGFRGVTSKTVCRRMDVLNEGGYIAPSGKRPGAVQGECILYKITRKGLGALRMDRRSGDEFLDTATEEKLDEFLRIY